MALVAAAALLHSYQQCAQRLRVAKKRGLWLDAPGGPTLALAPDAPLEYGAPLLCLDELDRKHPQRFYLPDASFEQLADWWAARGLPGCPRGPAGAAQLPAPPLTTQSSCCGRRRPPPHTPLFALLPRRFIHAAMR